MNLWMCFRRRKPLASHPKCIGRLSGRWAAGWEHGDMWTLPLSRRMKWHTVCQCKHKSVSCPVWYVLNSSSSFCRNAGPQPAHCTFVCECFPNAPCWAGSYCLGCQRWAASTRRLESLGLDPGLWPRRCYCVPGIIPLHKVQTPWAL